MVRGGEGRLNWSYSSHVPQLTLVLLLFETCMCTRVCVCVCMQCGEDVRKTLEGCDIDADIDLFVQQKSTGGERPGTYATICRLHLTHPNTAPCDQQQHPSDLHYRRATIRGAILMASFHFTFSMSPLQLPFCMRTTTIQKRNCPNLEVHCQVVILEGARQSITKDGRCHSYPMKQALMEVRRFI